MTPSSEGSKPDVAVAYEFGSVFRLEPHNRRLLANDADVHVAPKHLDVLILLVERQVERATPSSPCGHLVTYVEFRARVWPDAHVEDTNLTVAITALRQALGGSKDQYIKNAPKQGYRFQVPVTVVPLLTSHPAMPAATEPANQTAGTYLRIREFEEGGGRFVVYLNRLREACGTAFASHFVRPDRQYVPQFASRGSVERATEVEVQN